VELNFSNYLEEKILTDYIINDNVYFAIFGNLAGESKTADEILSELEYGDLNSEIVGYTGNRKELLYTTVAQDKISDTGEYIDSKGETKNDNSILLEDLPECEILAVAIMDGLSAGNVLFYTEITPQEKTAGSDFDVKAEQFILKTD